MCRKWAAILLIIGWIFLIFSGCNMPLTVPTAANSQGTPVSSQPSQPTSQPTTIPSEPQADPIVICIDAGHQQKGIYDQEPIGPGATATKAKLSSGAQGITTKIPEYQLNLDVALLLEQELLARGYKVIMIRRNNDCPLSNAQRAQIANESGADIFVRIHANSAEDTGINGMLCCAPTTENPYLPSDVVSESIRLSQIMVEKFCMTTGAQNRGIYYVDTMTGINWCQIPVTIVEMGFMSNPQEDSNMATPEYRAKMVDGIAAGIDTYFEI